MSAQNSKTQVNCGVFKFGVNKTTRQTFVFELGLVRKRAFIFFLWGLQLKASVAILHQRKVGASRFTARVELANQ